MHWSPHVTVAAVLEQDNKFLLVEENIEGQLLLNQPAGHWEPGETIIDASIRETLEETAWYYQPTHLVGIYQWRHPDKNEIFLRFCFSGNLLQHEPDRQLDKEIVNTVWLTEPEVLARSAEHRSPMVHQCIVDYQKGHRHDLAILKTFD